MNVRNSLRSASVKFPMLVLDRNEKFDALASMEDKIAVNNRHKQKKERIEYPRTVKTCVVLVKV